MRRRRGRRLLRCDYFFFLAAFFAGFFAAFFVAMETPPPFVVKSVDKSVWWYISFCAGSKFLFVGHGRKTCLRLTLEAVA
jgi:hypothetical protein